MKKGVLEVDGDEHWIGAGPSVEAFGMVRRKPLLRPLRPEAHSVPGHLSRACILFLGYALAVVPRCNAKRTNVATPSVLTLIFGYPITSSPFI